MAEEPHTQAPSNAEEQKQQQHHSSPSSSSTETLRKQAQVESLSPHENPPQKN